MKRKLTHDFRSGFRFKHRRNIGDGYSRRGYADLGRAPVVKLLAGTAWSKPRRSFRVATGRRGYD